MTHTPTAMPPARTWAFDFSEGTCTLDCGCTAKQRLAEPRVWLKLCKMHQYSPDLLAALEALADRVGKLSHDALQAGDIDAGDIAHGIAHDARQAIALAKGEAQ